MEVQCGASGNPRCNTPCWNNAELSDSEDAYYMNQFHVNDSKHMSPTAYSLLLLVAEVIILMHF